jgi:hypothetical protein
MRQIMVLAELFHRNMVLTGDQSRISAEFSRREQNYSTTERELLAVVLSVEHYRQFLYGVHFVVKVDHQPLKALMKIENPTNK